MPKLFGMLCNFFAIVDTLCPMMNYECTCLFHWFTDLGKVTPKYIEPSLQSQHMQICMDHKYNGRCQNWIPCHLFVVAYLTIKEGFFGFIQAVGMVLMLELVEWSYVFGKYNTMVNCFSSRIISVALELCWNGVGWICLWHVPSFPSHMVW